MYSVIQDAGPVVESKIEARESVGKVDEIERHLTAKDTKKTQLTAARKSTVRAFNTAVTNRSQLNALVAEVGAISNMVSPAAKKTTASVTKAAYGSDRSRHT